MSSSDNVVVLQPGTIEKENQSTPPEEAIYEPTGLKDLRTTNIIQVHQHLDVLEVLLCWERSNRYQVCDSQGKQIFYVYEVGDCFARKLLGASRGLSMKMSDNDSQDVVAIHRPLRCTTRYCWWCCHLQEMQIHSPPGTPVASVKEIWKFGQPQYNVYNLCDELLYTMVGDCCHCRAVADVTFKVFDNSVHEELVAKLTKHWGGCREIIGASNDFSVTYVKEMDVKQKLVLFAAVYLIDFNHFERHCRC